MKSAEYKLKLDWHIDQLNRAAIQFKGAKEALDFLIEHTGKDFPEFAELHAQPEPDFDNEQLARRLQSFLDRLCNDNYSATMFEGDACSLREAIEKLRNNYKKAKLQSHAQKDPLDTAGNRHPQMRYAGYKGQPLAVQNCTADEIAAYDEGVRASKRYESQAQQPDQLTIADYEEGLEDHRRLAREIDVVLNGKNAARQPSLCDILSQLKGYRPSTETGLHDRLLQSQSQQTESKQLSRQDILKVFYTLKDKDKHFPMIEREISSALGSQLFVYGWLKAVEFDIQPPAPEGDATLKDTPFIDWDGSECPVEGATEVEYMLRESPKFIEKSKAMYLDWGRDVKNHDRAWDIIAYRVAPEGGDK